MFSRKELLKNHYNHEGQKLLDGIKSQDCVEEMIKNIEKIMTYEPNKYLVLTAAKDLLTIKLSSANKPNNSLSEIRKISQELKILSALTHCIEESKNTFDIENFSRRINTP